MYKLTSKAKAQRERLALMRAGRDRARMALPSPDRPAELPELRKRLTVENFDFEYDVHVLEFFKSDRRDCFRVVVDGVEWKKRIGWSKALEGLRKSMPRVGAE